MRIPSFFRVVPIALAAALFAGGTAVSAYANDSGNHFGVTYARPQAQDQSVAQNTYTSTSSDATGLSKTTENAPSQHRLSAVEKQWQEQGW